MHKQEKIVSQFFHEFTIACCHYRKERWVFQKLLDKGKDILRRKMDGLSIQIKMLLSMMIIIVLFFCLTTIFNSIRLYNERIQQVVLIRNINSALVADRMEISSRNYLNLFYSYMGDNLIRRDLFSWGLNGEDLSPDMWDRLSTFNFTTITLNPEIETVEIYNFSTGEVLRTNRSESSLIQKVPYFWEGVDENTQNTLTFLEDNGYIIAVHQVNDFPNPTPIALIVFRLRDSSFHSIMRSALMEDDECIFLFNDENQIIYHICLNEELFDEIKVQNIFHSFQTENFDFIYSDGYFAFYSPIHNNRLKMVQIVLNAPIREEIVRSIFSDVIVSLSVLLISIVLSIYLSRRISNPIKRLTKKMKNLNIDQLDTFQTDIHTNKDELGYLEESFNEMVRRNHDLIDREYKSKIVNNRIQLKALQAQINPHFMHNTLQAMGSMAIEADSNELYSTILTLSEMMRYLLDFSLEMVSLIDELVFVNSYIFIQNKRYGGKIHVEQMISDEVLSIYIPKLVIQPIIENAIEHGYLEREKELLIKIKEYSSEGDICIVIEDNGIGMTDKKLQDLQLKLSEGESQAISSSDHIGLVNIHSRLRLKYGKGYGISISSNTKIGRGIIVKIKLKGENYE